MLCELGYVYEGGVQAYIHQLPAPEWGGEAYSLQLSLCDEVFLLFCTRRWKACFHSTNLSHSSSIFLPHSTLLLLNSYASCGKFGFANTCKSHHGRKKNRSALLMKWMNQVEDGRRRNTIKKKRKNIYKEDITIWWRDILQGEGDKKSGGSVIQSIRTF